MSALLRTLTALLRVLTLPLLRGIGGIATTIALPTFRALSGILLVVAAVALAHDAGNVSSNPSKGFQPTSVLVHWQQLAAPALDNTKQFVTKRMRPWVWDALSAPLRLPSFVFFTLLAIVFGYCGRHHRRVEIFAN
jgi:hypothetical protein